MTWFSQQEREGGREDERDGVSGERERERERLERGRHGERKGDRRRERLRMGRERERGFIQSWTFLMVLNLAEVFIYM